MECRYQSSLLIDIAEKCSYAVLLKDELRLDGRAPNDYRPILVEFNNINNSYGSCQLTLVTS